MGFYLIGSTGIIWNQLRLRSLRKQHMFFVEMESENCISFEKVVLIGWQTNCVTASMCTMYFPFEWQSWMGFLQFKLTWAEQKAKFFWSAFVRCHHCFHKLRTISSSSPEPLKQFKPNLAQGLIVWFHYLLNVSEIFNLVKVLNMEPIVETIDVHGLWVTHEFTSPQTYIK